MATNTHGTNYISKIELPKGNGTETYFIHDEDAIHSLDDLGLSTPLNFKGVVDDYAKLPTGETLQTYAIDTYLEIYGGNRTTVGWYGVNEILQNPAYYPLEITYREESVDSVSLTNILKTPQTTWRSESFSSLLFSDVDKEQLYYDQATNTLNIVGSGQTTAKAYKSSYGHSVTEISLTLTSIPHNGDVYLVKDGTDTTPDQEYVYIIPDDGSDPYWEPLGNVHDAASSKHTHTVGVAVSGTVATQDITDVVTGNIKINPVTVVEIDNTTPSKGSGTAASWSASVNNGVLSFSWTPNEIAYVPNLHEINASLVQFDPGTGFVNTVASSSVVMAVTHQDVNRNISATATVTVSEPVEPNTNPTT